MGLSWRVSNDNDVCILVEDDAIVVCVPIEDIDTDVFLFNASFVSF